jgi:hypothetical protein
MSSVVVRWTGRCPDPAARTQLVGHLHKLAEMSDDFLRTRLPSARSRGRRIHRANIECVSQIVSGNVIVSSEVSGDRDGFVAAMREAGLATVDHPEVDRASIAFLERARLSGIDFRLFDPRALYPDADRLSFVFLDAKEVPFLDGRLVQVARQQHDAEQIRAASFYLSAPNIQLRGYLEDWADLLLSWVKYFFVEDLVWRRREEMQGYEDYRDIFLDVETTLGRDRAEQATFDAIVATFAQHAEHWSKEVAAGAEV